MSVVIKLMIMCVVALLVTLTLLGLEWRTKTTTKSGVISKSVLAVVLLGVLISLLTVR
ncbi:hypothetical protein [Lacticaseibacillus mingshuiensis]|uniref:DUF3976 domain-containing protein n=1 Tax=Lacticaseibacillus mingshuiensis TaxID=2799574 RepID=A0ABW4CIT0_9LACO|nr:hypothetical protein [Lacticaseibacillus mingshuiensis]